MTLQKPINVLHSHQISEPSFVSPNEAAAELSFIWSNSAVSFVLSVRRPGPPSPRPRRPFAGQNTLS